MTPCPSPEALQTLLADSPSGPEVATLVAHLETCRHCQEVLEQWTRAPNQPRTEPASENQNGPVFEPRAEFLEQLQSALRCQAHLAGGGDNEIEEAESQRPLGAGPAGKRWPAVEGFEILRELGRGAMGVVYQARQIGLNRLVALKMILDGEHAGAERHARFRREAEAVARLHHPNIVQIYEIGEQDGRPFFSMEWVDGCSLARQTAGTPQNPRAAAGFVQTLARAVQVAHEQGIIHRDLKPANILLQKSEIRNPKSEKDQSSDVSDFGFRISDFTPKVTDFGLAKQLIHPEAESSTPRQAGLTQSGAIIGTPSYMAPEQVRAHAESVGPAADVYGLGAILYELLTGRPPFRAETPLETVLQVRHEEPVPPTRLQSKVPRDLETICLKCLQKEPGRRYASAGDLAEDLGRFLGGAPVRARPTPWWERGMKWARRNPGWAAATGLVLAIMGVSVGAVVVSLGLWHRAEVARQGEVAQRHQAETSEQEAKRSAEDAQAVLEFFQNQVLSAARPENQEGGLGINATIRTAVDAAEPKIAAAFHDRPLVEASVRYTLGETYSYLHESKAAIAQYERALELRQNELGPDSPWTLVCMNNLAAAYKQAGQLGKAVSLYDQVLAKRRETLGPDHPYTLVSMNNLASAYQAAGQLDKAIPIYKQALEKQQEKLGPNHPQTFASMNNLAGAYYDAGQSDKALLDKAMHLFRQTLAKSEETLGPDHPNTLTTMNNLAEAYKAVDQLDKAFPLYQRALAKQQEKLGPDHPNTLRSMNNLALAYHAAGRFDEAIPRFEETLEKYKEKLDPDHPLTLAIMSNLAEAYKAAGRFDEAVPLFEQVLAKRKEKLGPDHPDTLSSMNNLAAAHGDPAKAERILREALGIHQRKHPDAWMTFATQSQLGASLLRQKKYAEAEPMLLAGYEGLKQRQAKIPLSARKYLTESLERLVQLYHAWGKSEQAKEWRQKLEQARAPATAPVK